MKKLFTLLALLLAGNLYAQEAMYIMYSPIFPSRERSVGFLYAGKKLGFHFGVNGGNAKNRQDSNTFARADLPDNAGDIDRLVNAAIDQRGVAVGLTLRMSKYLTVFGGVDFLEYRAYEKWRDIDGDQVGSGEYFVRNRALDFNKEYGYFGAIVHAFNFVGVQVAYYPVTKEVLAGAGVTFDLLW